MATSAADPAPLARAAIRRDHPRREPSAVVPHAGICAGGGWQQPSLPQPIRVAERRITRGGEAWWRYVTPCGVAVGDCAVCDGCAGAFWGCQRAAVLGPGG